MSESGGTIGRPRIATVGVARAVRPRPERDAAPLEPGELWLAAVGAVLPIALGGTVVAVAYAAGRAHMWGASGLFWTGQALIFLPAAYRILGRRGESSTHLLILVAIAAVQAALVWAYSPDVFRFPDELQHLRTARDILATHKLFTPNPTLPVSPGFPGMEEVTTAISTMTGLSVYASGRIMASLSHVLVTVFLYGAFQTLSGSRRTAAIGVLMYTTDPHYAYFDVLWAYGTPGLAFLALLFRNTMLTIRKRGSPVFIALAFIPMLLTHHLTTLVGLCLLAALTAATALGGERMMARRLAVVSLLLLAVSVIYIVVLTPATIAYLGAPLAAIFAAFSIGHATGTTASQGAAHLAPAWESMVEMLGVGVTLASAAAGILLTWWSNTRRSVQLLAACGLVYVLVLAIRLAAPDGAELASRALTYAMFLIAFAMAVAFEFIYRPRVGRAAVLLPLAVFGFLVVATIVAAQPPAWERIPGHVDVAAEESGVDTRVLTLTHWMSERHWGRNIDVACDLDVCAEVGAMTDANPSTDASAMYSARTVSDLNSQISKITVDYVETDKRWTQQVPPTGSYFPQDPVQHTRPLPASVITRFDRDPPIDRIYDDGDIHIYDTYWVWHQ